MQVAEASGTNNRCAVCHGGDTAAVRPDSVAQGTEAYTALAKQAHTGTPAYFEANPGPKEFYPDPGSPWVNVATKPSEPISVVRAGSMLGPVAPTRSVP